MEFVSFLCLDLFWKRVKPCFCFTNKLPTTWFTECYIQKWVCFKQLCMEENFFPPNCVYPCPEGWLNAKCYGEHAEPLRGQRRRGGRALPPEIFHRLWLWILQNRAFSPNYIFALDIKLLKKQPWHIQSVTLTTIIVNYQDNKKQSANWEIDQIQRFIVNFFQINYFSLQLQLGLTKATILLPWDGASKHHWINHWIPIGCYRGCLSNLANFTLVL